MQRLWGGREIRARTLTSDSYACVTPGALGVVCIPLEQRLVHQLLVLTQVPALQVPRYLQPNQLRGIPPTPILCGYPTLLFAIMLYA